MNIDKHCWAVRWLMWLLTWPDVELDRELMLWSCRWDVLKKTGIRVQELSGWVLLRLWRWTIHGLWACVEQGKQEKSKVLSASFSQSRRPFWRWFLLDLRLCALEPWDSGVHTRGTLGALWLWPQSRGFTVGLSGADSPNQDTIGFFSLPVVDDHCGIFHLGDIGGDGHWVPASETP